LTTRSISPAVRSICARSLPATLMPSGLLMPVASMSIRLRIGGIQMLVRPGRRTRLSSSSTSFSTVMPGRHSLCGLSCTTVSTISSGAGSVAVSARPIFPNTLLTSGTVAISLSVCCSSCAALPVEIPGRADGI
jgi:hypothetical protein